MNDIRYQEVTDEYLGTVREIYNYYVENTTISFHTELLTLEEMRESVLNANPKFPSYVILSGEDILGYVLLTQHKKKQAYDASAEVTIYLKTNQTGRGLGGQALRFIEGVARTKGFHSLVATVCAENEASRYLFEKHGYSQCALFKEIGLKFGRRLDILVFQKMLEEPAS